MIPIDTSAEELARLAAERPDLWGEIQHHPNAYPELRQWISEAMHASAPGASAMRQQAPQDAERSGASAPPSGTGPSKASQRIAVIAAVLSLLLLVGAGFGLSATGTWPFNAGGPLGGTSAARTAADEEALPTFADGIEERWAISGEELGGRPLIFQGGGVYPKGFTPGPMGTRFNAAFDGGVVLSYEWQDRGGYSMAWLDAAAGERTWEREDIGEAADVGCLPSESGDRVYCVIGRDASSELLVFDGSGDPRTHAVGGPVTTFSVDERGFSVLGGSRAARFDVEGQMLWERDLELNAGDGLSTVDTVGDRTLVRSYPEGWQLLDGDGETLATDLSGNVDFDSENGQQGHLVCDAALAGDRVFLFGSCDDPSAGDLETTTLGKVPQFTATISGDTSVLVAHEFDGGESEGRSIAYDAASGERIWEVPYFLSSGQPTPGTVLSISSTADVTGSATDALDTSTGAERYSVPGSGWLVSGAVVTQMENSLLGYDLESGEELWTVHLPGYVALGSGRGIASLDFYSDGDLDSIAFFAPPAAGSTDASPGEAVIPAGMPFDCPGDTILLAWAELADGWVLVCGITLDEPTHMQVRLPDGSLDGTTSEVRWDPDRSRYVGSFGGDLRYTLDYDFGTVTVRDMDAGTTLLQEALIRYVFVVLGAGERTSADVEGTSGAFGVPRPEDTAEDQVRYMIEVLEKSYEGRAMLKEAMPKLQQCAASAGGYGDTIDAMTAVRDNRAELLEALDGMPVDKIPEGEQLLDDLTEAIAQSHAADVEYIDWAKRANERGCASLSATGQAAQAAADGPKASFAERWNRAVAPKFDVRTFDGWFI